MKRKPPKWNTIRVREATYREIEKALQNSEVEKAGISNITQFATDAITRRLEELKTGRMAHLNMHADHVKIIDNKLDRIGRIVSVYFRKANRPWCDYCEKRDCIHVQYAWEIPKVKKILKGHGLKPPPSRV